MVSTAKPNNGDEESERELIDAEFESMVAGLSLDESTPSTFLDELDALNDGESDRALYAYPTNEEKSLQQKFSDSMQALKSWWSRKDNNEGDGAVV